MAIDSLATDEALRALARRIGTLGSRPARVDFYRLLDCMRAGGGANRIVSDVESARASAVASAPALFVNGERYGGDLDAPAVWAALAGARNEP